MQEQIKGKIVWQFGENFNADLIVGSKYIDERDPELLGKACLCDLDPTFAERVRPGDIMIAGENFGYGHPHQQGIVSMKKVGISTLIAESFYPLWYRMAIFYALPIIVCPGISRQARTGDELAVDLTTGGVTNLTTDQKIQAEPFPPFLMEVVQAGGLIKYLQKA
jgi:3-isopropylmalate dehydratase small subunit